MAAASCSAFISSSIPLYPASDIDIYTVVNSTKWFYTPKGENVELDV